MCIQTNPITSYVMRFLFVVAHPDDECDGAGATIHKLATQGHSVAVAIMAGNAEARRIRSDTLDTDKKAAISILGVKKLYQASFPNIQMNAQPRSELLEFVDRCLDDWRPEVVVTHHLADTNNDHAVTSSVVQEAVRRQMDRGINAVYFVEAASATEWSLQSTKNRFRPNTFVEVGAENMEVKLRALDAYKNVARPYPHPQSREAYFGLAAFRGTQAGCHYAEAFECVYRRIHTNGESSR